jgi:hypothetical protein
MSGLMGADELMHVLNVVLFKESLVDLGEIVSYDIITVAPHSRGMYIVPGNGLEDVVNVLGNISLGSDAGSVGGDSTPRGLHFS